MNTAAGASITKSTAKTKKRPKKPNNDCKNEGEPGFSREDGKLFSVVTLGAGARTRTPDFSSDSSSASLNTAAGYDEPSVPEEDEEVASDDNIASKLSRLQRDYADLQRRLVELENRPEQPSRVSSTGTAAVIISIAHKCDKDDISKKSAFLNVTFEEAANNYKWSGHNFPFNEENAEAQAKQALTCAAAGKFPYEFMLLTAMRKCFSDGAEVVPVLPVPPLVPPAPATAPPPPQEKAPPPAVQVPETGPQPPKTAPAPDTAP